MNKYLTIATPSGSFQAYAVRPAILPAPAIVVVQEIFGVNADLRATCDELAMQGYLALCPDLFWRMRTGVDLTDQSEAEWKEAFELYGRFDRDKGVHDLAATLDFARHLPEATGKVGMMGYCLGGLMTYLTTARVGADASVAYYGADIDKYLGEAKTIRNPLMVHLGEEDEYIPEKARQAIVDALASTPNAQVFTYPGRCHAFARHGGKHYDRGDATLANARTAAFFQSHLGLKAG